MAARRIQSHKEWRGGHSMSSSDPVREFVGVVQATENPSDESQRKAALNWLASLEKSLNAWQVCDAVLNHTGLPDSVYFHAAHMLVQKCRYAFTELHDLPSRISFRDSLMKNLFKFANAAGTVRRQLAGAVALVVLQMPEWTDPISSLMGNMARQSSLAMPLLEVLDWVAYYTDSDNQTLSLDDRLRDRMRDILNGSFSKVLELLAFYYNVGKDDVRVLRVVLSTAAEWVRCVDVLVPDKMAGNPIYEHLMALVGTPEVFDEAEALLYRTLMRCDIQTADDAQMFDPLVRVLLPGTLSLRPLFERAQREKDVNTCKKLCDSFVRMARSFRQLLMNGSPQSMAVMELLLLCCSHERPDIAMATQQFWYDLSRDICSIQDSSVRDRRFRTFTPVFTRLIDVLCEGPLTLPLDYERWTLDDQEERKKYRYEAQETLSDAIIVVGATQCLDQVFRSFEQALEPYKQDPQRNWPRLEACLHTIRSIARAVLDLPADDVRDSHVLQQVMTIVPRLKQPHMVRYTSTLVISRYADYVALKPQLLPQLLEYIVGGLNSKKDAACSSLAFKNTCDACATVLARNYMQNLFAIYQQSRCLAIADQKEIIEGMCLVALALDEDALPQALQEMVRPVASDITQLMTRWHQECVSQSANVTNDAERNAFVQNADGITRLICEAFDRMAHIFKTMKLPVAQASSQNDFVPRICVDMLKGLWPVMSSVLKVFREDDRVMERLCRSWKYAIRTCGVHFQPFLIPLVKELTQLFTNHPHSSFLYVANICVETFGPHAQFHNVLADILHVFSLQTFQLLTGPESFAKHPEITEDYFELIVRFITCCPTLIYANPMLPKIFEHAIVCVGIQHREANTALMKFFSSLLVTAQGRGPKRHSQMSAVTGLASRVPELSGQALAQCHQVVAKLLLQYGQVLVDKLVNGVSGTQLHSLVRSIAGAISDLIDFAPNQSQHWVHNALRKVPETRSPSRQEFCQSLFSGPARARRKSIYAFNKACGAARGKVF